MRGARRSIRPALLLVLVAGAVSLSCLGRAGAAPARRGGTLRLLVEPNDGFRSVYALLSSAERRVDMTMYELDDATAERDLVADARRGVDVRVLLDKAYHGGSVNQRAFSYLSSHGVHVRWGPPSTIVHEKAIVVDGTRALIATFNLADRYDYYATTRDFGVLDTDRADVAAIARVFASDWRGRPVRPPPPTDGGADLLWSPGAEPALASLIDHARHSLLVESEEMADARIVSRLAAAARRGVDVEVVMTADSAWTRRLDQLSRAGVHVRTYAYDARPYIHAKVAVADAGRHDQELFLGSENFSYASLDHDRELGLVTRDGRLAAAVARTVRADFAGARPWTR